VVIARNFAKCVRQSAIIEIINAAIDIIVEKVSIVI
jgi:hypothetical protein